MLEKEYFWENPHPLKEDPYVSNSKFKLCRPTEPVDTLPKPQVQPLSTCPTSARYNV